MGRTLSLEKIPSGVRNSFVDLCADQPGLTLDDHVEWFANQGYKVSRSALHRYTKSCQTDETVANQNIRLQCLTLASSFAAPGDKGDLLRIAEELVAWVKSS